VILAMALDPSPPGPGHGLFPAPMPPATAVLLVADVVAQLADLHAAGRAAGPLDAVVRLDTTGDRPRATLAAPPVPAPWDGGATDVRAAAGLLVRLLRPLPEPVSATLRPALDPDPAVRPPADVLARQLRALGRDLLLGVAPWQGTTASPSVDPPAGDVPAVAPGFVPGAGRPVVTEVPRPHEGAGRRSLLFAISAVATVLAVVGGGLALRTRAAGGPATTTTAAARPVEVCLAPECTVRVSFVATGNRVTVCDNREDGLSGVAVIDRAGSAGESRVWASSGRGTCVEETVGLRERTRVSIRACTGERAGERIDRCSGTVAAVT
jgi:hypothetical protein